MYFPIPAFYYVRLRLSRNPAEPTEDRRLIHKSYVGVQGPFLAAFDFKSLMGVNIDKNDKL